MKEKLSSLIFFTLNQIYQTVEYNWSDEFAREETRKAFEEFQKEISKFVNWEELTEEDCDLLKFGRWSDENPIRLIPLCFLHCLPDGMELTSISGNKVIVGKDPIDNDVRWGFTAYGIIPKKNNDNRRM